jgi:hypothetical protein
LALCGLLGGEVSAQSLATRNRGLFPVTSSPYGKSHAQWSADWWKWNLEHPVSGHPFVDAPEFDVTSGQSGDVWFLSTPFGVVTRVVTIPDDKALFVGTLCSEWSSLEGYPSEAEQRDTAVYFGDHIIGMSCSLDGRTVTGIDAFRFDSPQFTFTAPSPWIFGEVGGTGTAVADGYYFFLKPLSVGTHVLHYTGSFHFSTAEGDPFDADFGADVTYILNVVPH